MCDYAFFVMMIYWSSWKISFQYSETDFDFISLWTNIYDCSIQALKVLYNYSDDYTKTVILMTDGHSNVGTYSDLREYYVTDNKIPIYSIMFGNAQSAELQEIARLSNAKVFDGRSNLLSAFKEVRSYN